MTNTTVQCPITKGKANFYCHKNNANYYINKSKQVIFLSPMPTISKMKEYANNQYSIGSYRDYLNAKDLKMLTANNRLKQITQYNPGQSILDIGCSAGFFLEAAQAHGYQVQGIEFASTAITHAASSIQDKIILGDLHQELDRWKHNLDWVSAFDIIEHMHDPVKFISNAKKILKPSGLLVISTPDTGHFLRRLMKSHWFMLQPLQHTVLFSRSAMKEMLLSEGFVNITIESTYKYLTLDYIAKQLIETNKVIASMIKPILTILPKAIRCRPFKINIGEFIVFAKTLSS